MNETTVIEPEIEKRTKYTHFIVSSRHGWGKAKDIKEAKRLCRKENPRGDRFIHYRAKLVTADTTCDGAGGISFPGECPPIELGYV